VVTKSGHGRLVDRGGHFEVGLTGTSYFATQIFTTPPWVLTIR